MPLGKDAVFFAGSCANSASSAHGQRTFTKVSSKETLYGRIFAKKPLAKPLMIWYSQAGNQLAGQKSEKLRSQDHSKEVPNMASIVSRRTFLKCAGVAALAVTASGILAGCSDPGGSSEDTVYGVNETVQTNGVNVKLLGYRLDPVSGMVGNYADNTLITVCFGLENASEQSVKMGNTTETELAEVLKAIYNNRYETLGKSDFHLASGNGKIGHAEIGYLTDDSGLKSFGVRDNLKPKETGCIKVYALVPSDWEQIGIRYTPYFAPNETYNFVLNRANKL